MQRNLKQRTLLLIAYDMGLCTSRMTHGTDYAVPDKGTAIKECCVSMGIAETEVADKDFVTKLYTAISAAYPKKGDYNGDGEVNIKDATAIQKHIAGLE
ncbi:MAG: hypothetical protein E7563_04520 [Ruminococcaceae bacterium]|nr:hypothetical protein [Oscillospiraceae bacterium]